MLKWMCRDKRKKIDGIQKDCNGKDISKTHTKQNTKGNQLRWFCRMQRKLLEALVKRLGDFSWD